MYSRSSQITNNIILNFKNEEYIDKKTLPKMTSNKTLLHLLLLAKDTRGWLGSWGWICYRVEMNRSGVQFSP
jgi:hypothetical protein